MECNIIYFQAGLYDSTEVVSSTNEAEDRLLRDGLFYMVMALGMMKIGFYGLM